MKNWCAWTEVAINKQLNGRFFQLQQKTHGSFVVVDLNEPDEEPESEPVAAAVEVPLIRRRTDGGLWMEDISRSVCLEFGVTKMELESLRRSHNLVAARQVLFWIAKRHTGHSLPFIGEWCNRDHTTVLHGIGRIDHNYAKYHARIERCLSRLGVSLTQEAA